MKMEDRIHQTKMLEASKVLQTLRYVKAFCGQTIMIKLGGAALEDVSVVKKMCEDLSLVRAAGISLVLVHGGGKAINQALKLHGIQWDFVDGQRVTTPEMMKIIEMVLSGQVNSQLVRSLNAAGINAVGYSGTDGSLFQCTRASELKYGEVGQVTKMNTELIEESLQSQKKSGEGVIPVVAPIGVDALGVPLNINADWAAVELAAALGVKKLIFLTDQKGIYDFKGKLFSELSSRQLMELIDSKVVSDGMLAKAQAVLQALNSGVEQVHIINGKQPHSLIDELFTDQGVGTVCHLSQENH